MDIARATLLRHLEYHAWATLQTLESVAPLSQEELLRDMQTSHSGVWGTLLHSYRADTVWLKRLQGQSNAKLADIEDASSLPDLQQIWQKTQAGLISVAGSQDAADYTRTLEYRLLSGLEGSTPVYDVFLHVVNHGTYHRGQIVTMLRQLGAEPIATDFIRYLRLAKA